MDIYPLLSNVLYLHKYRLEAADIYPLISLAFSVEGQERKNFVIAGPPQQRELFAAPASTTFLSPT